MAILISEARVFPLADTPDHVPLRRGGKRLHPHTAFGWAKGRLRGVRLETIRVGGSLCTSAEALQRFFERLSALDSGAEAEPAPRSPVQRGRAIAKARAQLAKLGV
jgi:hypothetical protein